VGAPVDADELKRLGLADTQAQAVARALTGVFESAGTPRPDPVAQERLWWALQSLLGSLGRPLPFELHARLFELVYAGRPHDADPAPAWLPSRAVIEASNLESLRKEVGAASYPALHQWSVEKRDQFWHRLITRLDIPFVTLPERVWALDSSIERPDWLPRAEFNMADACFRAPGTKAAILYASEADEALRTFTYAELEALANRVANGLDAMGLGERDPVALYLPMTPEAVAIYLGVIRSGRCVVGVADASAAPDLANKIRISGAKAVFTIDGYVRGGKTIPIYSKAVEAQAPTCIVLGRSAQLRPGDVRWVDFLSATRTYTSRPRKASDPTNILFSSGTTKDPKAIPWTQTTPIKAAVDAHLHHDVHASDVLAWPTTFGWMMGPWLTYATLVHGATMALYNGDPRGRGFTEFVQRSHVTILGLVPKLVASWRQTEALEGLDWSRIRLFSSTGETSQPEDMLWLMHTAGYKPVIEYCGGTEIGGGYITSTVVQSNAPGYFSTPALGVDFFILDEAGRPAERGEVALVPPSMGLSNDLLNYDHVKEYFADVPKGPHGEVLRRHGDLLERRGSYYRHLGRAKDMINVGGVKTSSEEIRAVLDSPDVEDTKPVAIDVDGRGQTRLVVYAVPRGASKGASDELRARLRTHFNGQIKARLNPLLAHVEDVVLVAELPQAGPGKTKTAEWFREDYLSRLASHKPTA